MAKAKVNAWGNATGIRLPKEFCERLGIRAGDEVSIELDRGHIVIEPAAKRWRLEERLKGWEGEYHAEEIDWGEPVGRERWWEEER